MRESIGGEQIETIATSVTRVTWAKNEDCDLKLFAVVIDNFTRD